MLKQEYEISSFSSFLSFLDSDEISFYKFKENFYNNEVGKEKDNYEIFEE